MFNERCTSIGLWSISCSMADSFCVNCARICEISSSFAAADSSDSSCALSGRLADRISSDRAAAHVLYSAGEIDTEVRERSRTAAHKKSQCSTVWL